MNNKYRTRKIYEDHYRKLCREAKIVPKDVSQISSFLLMNEMNIVLKKLNCLQFNMAERTQPLR